MTEEELDTQLSYVHGIEELFQMPLPTSGLKIKNKNTFYRIRRFDDWLMQLVHSWLCEHTNQHSAIGINDASCTINHIVCPLSAIKSFYDDNIVPFEPSFHMDLYEIADLFYISNEIARKIIKENYEKRYTKLQGKKINTRIFKHCLRRLKSTGQQHAIKYAWGKLNLLDS